MEAFASDQMAPEWPDLSIGMTADLQQEMCELRNNAARKLRSGFPQKSRDQRTLQLIAMPSFRPWASWELHKTRRVFEPNERSILVVESGRSDRDCEKLRDPVTRLKYPKMLQPALEVPARQISPEFAQSTLDDLRNMSLPVHPGSVPIALDGTSYELTTGFGLSGEATFSWHESAPVSWAPWRVRAR
jgi:hypothetical protein